MVDESTVRSWVESVRASFPFYASADDLPAYLNVSALAPRPHPAIDAMRAATVNPLAVDAWIQGSCAGIAGRLGVAPDAVIPTMGAHMTMERLVDLLDLAGPGRWLVDGHAHKAVINPLARLYRRGRGAIVPLRSDAYARLDLHHLEESLAKDVRAVFVNHVSSITGTIQEIAAAAAIVRDHRERTGATTLLIADGAQAVPRMPVDASPIDVYVVATQKVGGLPGSVAILSPDAIVTLGRIADPEMPPLPACRESLGAGTIHVEALASLDAALEFLTTLPAIGAEGSGWRSAEAVIAFLRDRLLDGLAAKPDVRVLAAPEHREENAGIVAFQVRGRDVGALGAELASRGVRIRAGTIDAQGHYFCVPFAERVLPRLTDRGALRASVWITNTPDDVDRLLDSI